MPKSRRRKGVRNKNDTSGRKFKGFNLDSPRAYYDPGAKPRPQNTLKDANRKPYKPKRGRGG